MNKDWLTFGEVVEIARVRCSMSKRKVLDLIQARDGDGRFELRRKVFVGCTHNRYCRQSLFRLLQIPDK